MIVSFAIPTAVVLSTWMGVGGCGWPISAKVRHIILPSFMFINSAPNSVSAADAATIFRMVLRVQIAPLRKMGFPLIGTAPREMSRCPALGAFGGKVRCVGVYIVDHF